MTESKAGGKEASRDFAVATNRRALHDYFVESTHECGLVLSPVRTAGLLASIDLFPGRVRICRFRSAQRRSRAALRSPPLTS